MNKSKIGGMMKVNDLSTSVDSHLAQQVIDKLIDHFGLTEMKKDAGYILPDGRLLDLQRSDTERKQYHRVIADLIPDVLKGVSDELSIVNLLVLTGIIRYEPTGRIHVAHLPTQEQRKALFDLMKYSVHEYRIIVSDINGATIGDQDFRSPAAHELKNFFSEIFSASNKGYKSDEFILKKGGANWDFIFRSGNQVIGSYCPETEEYELDESFSGVKTIFMDLVKNRQR